MKVELDPIHHINKLNFTNYLLVDKSLNIIKSDSNFFDDFSFSDFFYAKANIIKDLKGVRNGYEKTLNAAMDGHFQIEIFKGYRVFFVPFVQLKQVLIYSEKEVQFGAKKRISDNEFNDNQPLEILFKLDEEGKVLGAEDHHFFHFTNRIVGESVFEQFNSEDKDVLLSAMNSLKEGQDALNIRLGASIKNQQVFFIGVLVKGKKDRIILILRDDTERLDREFELNLKNKAIEHSPVGTYVIDYQDMFFLYANEAYYQITGFSPNQIVGGEISLFDEPYTNLFFVNDADGEERERYQESVRLKKRYEGEFLCKRVNGEEYWNSMISIPVVEEETGKTIFVGIVKDITEEKAANQRLLKAIINTQEQERSRFSLDLHDGLGQKLLAAKMNIAALEGHLELNGISAELYRKSLDLLIDAINETRSISHSLMSHTLKGFGLGNAVEEVIRSFSSPDIKFYFENYTEDKRFKSDIEVGAFRIIQELLNNVFKHSQALEINIKLKETRGNALLIDFRDNGIGFDQLAVLNKKGIGIGIRNIKTRILFLGGQFNLTTEKGKGSAYQIYIPLERE